MADYLLPATEVPACQLPPSIIDVAGGVPTTWEAVLAGDGDMLGKLARNAARGDATGRSGGGAYAVVSGLVPSVPVPASLNLPFTAGWGMLDGPVTKRTAFTVAQSPGASRAWQWMDATGAVTPVLNSLSPPGNPHFHCGSCSTTTDQVTSVDLSGVFYLRAGTLWVRTGDVGAPPTSGDAASLAGSLPTEKSFFHRTQDGLYIWDGSVYTKIPDAAADTLEAAIAELELELDDEARKRRQILRFLGTDVGFEMPDYLMDEFLLAMEEAGAG